MNKTLFDIIIFLTRVDHVLLLYESGLDIEGDIITSNTWTQAFGDNDDGDVWYASSDVI